MKRPMAAIYIYIGKLSHFYRKTYQLKRYKTCLIKAFLLPDSGLISEPSLNQHSLDPESKITLGPLSPGRLSPNIFLNLNIDHLGMDRNNLTLEWSSFPPTHPQTLQHPSQQMQSHQQSQDQSLPQSQMSGPNSLNLDSSPSSYDEIKFLNVDQFSMDNFKPDGILNLDQSILDEKQQSLSLDMPSFSLSEPPKTPPLMDLDKPIININVSGILDLDDKF